MSFNLNRVISNFGIIQSFNVASREMHNFINSLSPDDYADLATAYNTGRLGWERLYYDTNECLSYIESQQAYGIEVTEEMIDAKFLTSAEKKRQFDLTYNYEKTPQSLEKTDGIYRHNWLSDKTNIKECLSKGILLIQSI